MKATTKMEDGKRFANVLDNLHQQALSTIVADMLGTHALQVAQHRTGPTVASRYNGLPLSPTF